MASAAPQSGTASTSAAISSSYKTVNLATALLALRFYNALSIETFFQPDEFFQSLEPAWAAAFGASSGAWITWEWREHLRSSLHPLLFSALYTGVSSFCDTVRYPPAARAATLIAAPRVLQAVFAATTDLFTYRLACKIYGYESSMARTAIALTVLSPWQWFCSTRTFSNSLETTLTVVALDLWPWDWFLRQPSPTERPSEAPAGDAKGQQPRKPVTDAVPNILYGSLAAAAVACILRPTNVIIWATVSLALVFDRSDKSKMIALICSAILSGTAVLSLSLAMDWQYYGEFVFPPLRFLQFNVVQSLSTFYGTNRLHYYLTEGIALLLTTALPFAAVGVWRSLRAYSKESSFNDSSSEQRIQRTLALAVSSSISVLTLISHKEVRFIYPLLPILHILAARPLVTFLEPIWRGQRRYRALLLVLGLAINAVIGYYASYVHQRGVIDVMHYLRGEYETRYQTANKEMTVGFLMPCHSTPWRSHLVYPEIKAWALTCEPPLGLSEEERRNYLDEADIFYADPTLWINQNLERRETISSASALHVRQGGDGESGREWPDYIAFFEQLEPTMKNVLRGSRYGECWHGFNTHWHDDWRRQGDVVVWCRRGS